MVGLAGLLGGVDIGAGQRRAGLDRDRVGEVVVGRHVAIQALHGEIDADARLGLAAAGAGVGDRRAGGLERRLDGVGGGIGQAARTAAMAPATCGAAIEVPWKFE